MMAELPFGFTLRIPDSWYTFDVSGLPRGAQARIAAEPELAAHREALLKGLREIADLAVRRGAVFGAAMADQEDESTILATLLVFHTQGHADPAGNTVEAIASEIVAYEGRTWRRVELTEIPAGRAVRVSGVEESDGVDMVVSQTLVPVPGGFGVLDVVLTSPHLSLAEPMLDLFAAISATLTWSDLEGE
jgi:hypothetical protein